ncbi:biosynthetic-type acetolactate synthase large subunit [Zhaonella formicivorans]|uniref:biosynthetic-type acetolactate synthase large subunit n=1 Tax=Zhaonella formicivorans TaxID=2528593 RepID=UPI0010E2C1E5|nr:biosynthetic-type acetolactate synthase large subunit [Zhaonella formicivorans]
MSSAVLEELQVRSRDDVNKAIKEEHLTGAQILLKALEKEGVEVIFGYPGGANIPIYDELYRTKNITHILTRHEQGAVHAADGYARATGKPGVCLATSGPGATNLVTGIANAYMDSIPLVAITGQVALGLLGRDSFQEADITGITTPITKYSYLVKDVRDLARIVHEAFHLATTGRPGPVLIDLPKDITVQKAEFKYPPELDLPGYKPRTMINAAQIGKAAQAILEAKRPVIFAGGGVINAGASKELLALATLTGAPVTYSLMGKGAFPDAHPQCLGMVGMHGTAYANYAVWESDLLIGLGVRFDDRVTGKLSTFASQAKVIHIDIDPAELGKNVVAHVPIAGDVKEALSELLKVLKAKGCNLDLASWRQKIDNWKREYPLRYEKSGNVIKPQYVIEQINEVTKGEAYIVTEVGQHQMWAAQYYQSSKPRTFFTSGGLGTMGFGLPAAMGVQMAHPEAVVFNIAGDGSIQMNSQEFATIVHNKLPINVAILNNHYLGMVRQWQELFFGKRYSHTDMTGQPDFVKLAEAYGAVGLRVEKPEDVRPALEEAAASPRAYILDFVVDESENVFPMVPAGASLNEMLGR